MLNKVNLAESLASFTQTWTPKIAGDVNDFHVKLAKSLSQKRLDCR